MLMKNARNSFSGYSQRFIISQLSKSLCKGDYDSSCFWSVEMHISGWIEQWWCSIVLFCSTQINVSNPKISIFLWKIVNDFPGLVGVGNSNSSEVRQAIALTVGVCTFSSKDIPYTIPKQLTLQPHEELPLIRDIIAHDINENTLRASLQKDPQLMIRLFSQLTSMIENKNFYGALKVISICIFFEKHKKYKKHVVCARRMWKGLDKKHWEHWTLFVWDVLMSIANNYNKQDIIGSWRALYITNLSHTKQSSILPYIICSIGLLSQQIDLTIPCMKNSEVIYKGCGSIDLMYGDVFKANKIKK